MAGLVGVVGRVCNPATIDAALGSLRHHSSFSSVAFVATDNLFIGATTRAGESATHHEEATADVDVAVYGQVLRRDPRWRRLDARAVFERYQRAGTEALLDLDGSFVIVVIDRSARRLYLVNDRSATLPMTYARAGVAFAFAPEAKALFHLLPLAPRLDTDGLIGFLCNGYPIGDRTMFEGVKALPAGSLLTIELANGESTMNRYRPLRFSPERRLGLRQAAELLYESVLDAHEGILAGRVETQIALSGGHDSRVLLAAATRLGRLPQRALTWGVADDIPNSDPVIARALADSFGVPFRFMTYDSSSFVTNARTWAATSEMASDNLGFFAAGPLFLYDSNPLIPVLVGDHVIGLGSYPGSMPEAVESITKVPHPGLPIALAALAPQTKGEIEARYTAQLRDVVESSTSTRPRDILDHLTVELLASRWLFSPGYYKEPMATPLRPLMLNPVLDFYERLPDRLRVDKRVFLEMLRRHMPEAAAQPKSWTHSLIDWEHDIRAIGALRGMFEQLTSVDRVAAGPLATIIDSGCLQTATSRYFGAVPQSVSRRPSVVRRVFVARSRLVVVPGLGALAKTAEPWLKRRLGLRSPSDDGRMLQRIALISLLQECLDNGLLGRESNVGPSTLTRGTM